MCAVCIEFVHNCSLHGKGSGGVEEKGWERRDGEQQ